jgi:peroxiredoxin
MALSIGDPAPDLALTDTSGEEWVLSEHMAEGPTVLVFNRGFT